MSQNGGLGPEVGLFAQDLGTALAGAHLNLRSTPVLGGYSADSTDELKPSAGEVVLARFNVPAAVAQWRRNRLGKFLASVNRGTAVVLADVRAMEARCPSTQIVLAGYSQGAMAVHQAELKMTSAQRSRIAATVLVADGDRVHSTAAAKRLGSSPVRGEGVRSYLRMISARDAPLPRSTVNICNIHDIVCDFTAGSIPHYQRDTKVHMTYTKGPLLGQAAAWVAALLTPRGGGSAPPQPPGLITAGDGVSCALVAGGSADCWGDNSAGQLGSGVDYYSFDSPCSGHDCSPTPVALSGLTGATSISAGFRVVCALLSSGGVDCWGDAGSAYGGAGDGSGVPAAVGGLGRAIAISSGYNHSCALIAGGGAQCWGDGFFGQLGDGSGLFESRQPVAVRGLSGAVAISAGTQHTCALLSAGHVVCWGVGPLGDGTENDSHVPVAVRGLSGVRAISAGSGSCAILSSGTVDCWGVYTDVPRAVPGVSGAVAISEGYDGHACAIVSSGRVLCWGDNSNGQLGDGTTSNSAAAVAVAVSGISRAVAITAGPYHTCALLSGGRVMCWGQGGEGELGNGVGDSPVPVAVSGLP
jgi:alpha-tubulin suppressor-like RCC1 family protein